MTGPTPTDDRWSGESRGWRYIAQRIDGSGAPGELLDQELPLRDVQIVDQLSGPKQITGTLTPVYRHLLAADGEPILEEWRTVIHAEADGVIRASAILVTPDTNGPELRLDCTGISGYAKGMAYEGETNFVQVDPLDVVRHVWTTLQAGQDSNVGLVVDGTTSPVRIGQPEDPNDSSVGPFRLNPWDTDDLGQVVDDLARDTPFDYHEESSWNAARTAVNYRLALGYPRLGRRRPDVRLIVGENVQTIPTVTRDGMSFANHVRIRGAGDGRDQLREEARVRDGRLRRMAVVEAPEIKDRGRAQTRARDELGRRRSLTNVTGLVIRDHPSNPIGAFSVGDELPVQSDVDYQHVDAWFRALTIAMSPDQPDLLAVSVQRADAVP